MARVSATLCDLRSTETLHNAHRRPYVRYFMWAARVGARGIQNLCTGFLWAPGGHVLIAQQFPHVHRRDRRGTTGNRVSARSTQLTAHIEMMQWETNACCVLS